MRIQACFLIFAFFGWALAALGSSPKPTDLRPKLTVYAYDSLVAPGGLGPKIIPGFEKICGCEVQLIPSGDGSQLLNRVELEQSKGRAQVIWGIDQNLWKRAQSFVEPWGAWRPVGFDRVSRRLDGGDGFLPYDYGVYSWMIDTEEMASQKIAAPRGVADLLLKSLRRQLILEDPRTSTPGLAFVLFTHAVLGKGNFSKFWHSFRSQWLTLAPGWDQAYGLFLKGEAPLVWSYTTSEAYHREHDHAAKGRYRAITLREGAPLQIEGAALIRGGLRSRADQKRARQFLEYLISPQVQAMIPQSNWMLPVLDQIQLPASFVNLQTPRPLVVTETDPEKIRLILREWESAIQ